MPGRKWRVQLQRSVSGSVPVGARAGGKLRTCTHCLVALFYLLHICRHSINHLARKNPDIRKRQVSVNRDFIPVLEQQPQQPGFSYSSNLNR